MILWTIQRLDAWNKLQKSGVLSGRQQYVDPYFVTAYQWLVEQMKTRIGPPPEADVFPIWAWYQWEGQKKKPDLRSGGHLPKGELGVSIEFEASENRVLLSDFDLWHYVLNYWYLPKSLAEGDRFEAELEGKGMSFYKDKPLLDIKYHQQIVESWQRIFDFSWHDEDISNTVEQRSIQATLWELHMNDVQDIRTFKAR